MKAPSKGPVWSMTVNRVSGAIWKHENAKTGPRYTIALYREYYSRKESKTKRDFFYDWKDLPDLDVVKKAALEMYDILTAPAEPG